MGKVELKAQTLLLPLPAAMISCAAEGYKPNIITLSWIGIVNSEPPMLSISIRQNRYSHAIVKKAGEFIVNVTSEMNLKAVDYCGNRSGRDVDKFKEMGLTAIPGKIVKAPMIQECPINLECITRQSMLLGTHEMFIAEIVAVHVDEEILDSGKLLNIDKLKPLAYCPVVREYRGNMSKMMGRYGEVAGKKGK